LSSFIHYRYFIYGGRDRADWKSQRMEYIMNNCIVPWINMNHGNIEITRYSCGQFAFSVSLSYIYRAMLIPSISKNNLELFSDLITFKYNIISTVEKSTKISVTKHFSKKKNIYIKTILWTFCFQNIIRGNTKKHLSTEYLKF